jgi:predicted RND superfamily exporter protein
MESLNQRSFILDKLFKHPWVIVGVIAAITVFFASQLPKVRMDNNVTSFLPEDNQARVVNKHLEAEYGDELTVIVVLEPTDGMVFDRAFLSRIKEFTESVETVEMVKGTNSLLSAQYITSDNESIIVTDLVDEDFSGTPDEITELKRRIASWDSYLGYLVSDDLTSTQIMITINTSSDNASDPEVVALIMRIQGMAKEMFAEYAAVYTAGQPVVSAALSESSLTDVKALVPLAIVVLLTILALSFRRFSYVILPLLAVLVATIWEVGVMPPLGKR